MLQVRKWVNSFLNLIYPLSLKCSICEGVIQSEQEHEICHACLRQIIYISDRICVICGKMLDKATHKSVICSDCQQSKRSFACARSAVAYEGVVKEMIWQMKFYQNMKHIHFMAELMVDTWRHEYAHLPLQYLVPVPTTIEKLQQRGYNQAELLANEISMRTGVTVLQPLIRRSFTEGHTLKGKKDRWKTMGREYQFDDGAGIDVTGATVLLIDDVFTTGATVENCTNELLQAGATCVSILTFARS